MDKVCFKVVNEIDENETKKFVSAIVRRCAKMEYEIGEEAGEGKYGYPFVFENIQDAIRFKNNEGAFRGRNLKILKCRFLKLNRVTNKEWLDIDRIEAGLDMINNGGTSVDGYDDLFPEGTMRAVGLIPIGVI